MADKAGAGGGASSPSSLDFAGVAKEKKLLRYLLSNAASSSSPQQQQQQQQGVVPVKPSGLVPVSVPRHSVDDGKVGVGHSEEVVFSDLCVKINRRGKRQSRVLVITTAAIYNFRPNQFSAPTRRIVVSQIEALLLSVESSSMVVFHVRDEYDYRYETPKRPALVKVMNIVFKGATKTDLEVMNLPNTQLEEAFVTKQKMKLIKEGLAMTISHTKRLPTGSADDGDVSLSVTATPEKPSPDGGAASISSREKSSLSPSSFTNFLARKSMLTSTTTPTPTSPPPLPPKYKPRCPMCTKDLGVCNAIWSLVERALEPLNDLPPMDVTSPSTSETQDGNDFLAGLIRCADILIKMVGKKGPQNSGEAIRSIVALCFDHDAARALVKSMDDNIPILGGAALIDSLDALQRCEVPEVRKWAIKGLWKLLPMCMSENTLPTTSAKWMSALSGTDSATEQANQGEAAFVSTYFRGPMVPPDLSSGKTKRAQNQGVSKRPLSGRQDRKGSFAMLGASFRNSEFPAGLSYLMVQQAFAQVLLQNMFDLQRRATYSHIGEDGTVYENDEGDPKSPRFQASEPYTVNVRGVEESDGDAVMEILLSSMIPPTDKDCDRRIEAIGKRIQNVMLLPTLMGLLVLVQSDAVRALFLKEVSLLLLRSESNLQCVLAVPDWQMLFVALLQTVPDAELARSAEQQLVYKLVLNLLTMIHTYCFKDPLCESGPLLFMMGKTMHCLALYSGWSADAVTTARIIILGLLAQLAMTGRHWWYNPDSNEWECFLLVLRSIETFVFLLPGLDDLDPNSTGMTPVGTKKSVAGKLIASETAGTHGVPSISGVSVSSDPDDADSVQHMQSSGSIARAFSVTPLYILYKYEPALKPLPPQKQLINYNDQESFSWIRDRIGLGALGEKALNESVLKKSGSQPGFGLHLLPGSGLCADHELIQKAILLLRDQGVSGKMEEDEKKRKQMKSASKKYKGLLKQASEDAAMLKSIGVFMRGLDESVANKNEQLTKDILDRLAKFLEARYKRESMTTKLTPKKTKAVVKKIPPSALHKHIVKEQLEKHKVGAKKAIKSPASISATPQNVPKKNRQFSMIPGHTRRESVFKRQSTMYATAGVTRHESTLNKSRANLNLNQNQSQNHSRTESSASNLTNAAAAAAAAAAAGSKAPMAVVARLSQFNGRRGSHISTISRARFYSSVTDLPGVQHVEEYGDDDSEVGPRSPPVMPEVGSPLDSKSAKKKTMMPTKSSAAMKKQMSSSSIRTYGGARKAEEDLPKCNGCGRVCDDDFDTIEKLGEVWHVDCFKCDQCGNVLLNQEKPDDALFFDDPELVLFCSALCREEMLDKYNRNMCPYCMCTFVKGEKAVEGCNRLWHAAHFRCTQCKDLIGVGGKKEYFEVDGWPFCESCNRERFRTCNKCHQPISDKDDAVDALGYVWHKSHFGCFKCGVPFSGEYFVEGKGDQRRAYCQKHYISLFESSQIKCETCSEVLTESDQAVELAGKSYHLKKCFACKKCAKQLSEGDTYEEGGRPYCSGCWRETFGFTCTSCGKLIEGDVLHTEDKQAFHPDCFMCPKCDGSLLGRYVMTTDKGAKKPMCEAHYFEAFQKKCSFCQLPIDSKELAEALGKHYHQRCMICNACARPLNSKVVAGPDGNMYCSEHEHGKCAADGCSKPAWSNEEYFRAVTDGLFYCREHQEETDATLNFGDTCSGCHQPLLGSGVVVPAKKNGSKSSPDRRYHSECFRCAECGQCFAKTDHYIIDKNGDPVHKNACSLEL